MSSSMFTAIPTPSSLLSAYASITTSIMLFRTMFDQLFPPQIRRYIVNFFRFYWKPKSSKLSLVFEEDNGMTIDHMFAASEDYLCTKIGPDSKRLRVTKDFKEKDINIKFAETEEVADSFEGIPVMWKFVRRKIPEEKHGSDAFYDSDDDSEYEIDTKSDGTFNEQKYIELIFDKQYREKIIGSYLPWILKYHQELQNKKKVVKLYKFGRGFGASKYSVNLDHPSTFDTLAMDPETKKGIVDDLDRFLSRKDYYKRVGKAWKRGYLLYGPPGTGKSSLIAAIANYLKFDIYDLQLSNVDDDLKLVELLLKTSNRSILVVEDIDCSTQLPGRNGKVPSKFQESDGPQFSLAGLLNFIDGLWSSCGDERIIIFTTNHKDKLDPALLRPGRMDKHIHMSYLTVGGFTTLAANYLNIHGDHWRFKEIKELISCKKVTPAEVAEQLMTSDDVEVALEGLVTFLNLKKMEEDETNIPPHETEE